MYYEIDYSASPIPGVGKFVIKGEKVPPAIAGKKAPETPETLGSEKDPVRELFGRMRNIGRKPLTEREVFGLSLAPGFRNEADTMYRQGRFMADFSDDYGGGAPPYDATAHSPRYQEMGYEQLRAYFAWRTRVREGDIRETSRGNAFLYLFELLHNIGFQNPDEALAELLRFRDVYGKFDDSVERYAGYWLKDYFVYYDIPGDFHDFARENGLPCDSPLDLDFFRSISKYRIEGSAFYRDGREELVKGCLAHVHDALRAEFGRRGLSFCDFLFGPPKKLLRWTPFQPAPFFQWREQRERRVAVSAEEMYFFRNGRWRAGKPCVSEYARKVAEFVLRRAESALRAATGYRGMRNDGHLAARPKPPLGEIPISELVAGAALEFYRNKCRIEVRLDEGFLEKIRQESLEIQEKLIVPDCEPESKPEPKLEPEPKPSHVPACGPAMLTPAEKQALAAALSGDGFRAAARALGLMPEVLLEGINEKAVEFFGDCLLDENFSVYGEYAAQAKEMLS